MSILQIVTCFKDGKNVSRLKLNFTSIAAAVSVVGQVILANGAQSQKSILACRLLILITWGICSRRCFLSLCLCHHLACDPEAAEKTVKSNILVRFCRSFFHPSLFCYAINGVYIFNDKSQALCGWLKGTLRENVVTCCRALSEIILNAGRYKFCNSLLLPSSSLRFVLRWNFELLGAACC